MDKNRALSILKINQNASLDEIKKAYRRLAFLYHPDLNPRLKDATKKFQELNEAYVFLISEYKKKPSHQRRSKPYTTYENVQKNAYYTTPKKEFFSKKYRSQKHYTKTRKEEKTTTYTSSLSQEEILKNILNDPFARQVFEDIFREVKKRSIYRNNLPLGRVTRLSPLEQVKKITDIFSISNIKNWLKSQLDHEHIIYLEKKQIIPGAKLKFQITQFKKRPTQIITKIPENYVVGKAIRLKGLGKRLGPFKGDLYIRIFYK
ncbi:hypothetical protein JCM12298_06050 [Desulfothermus naphthae]